MGYHPAYVYNKPRTPLNILLKARDIAKKEGIKHCYLGNIYRDDVSNTHCKNCNNLLIQRFGLTIINKGLDKQNKCINCGTKAPIKGMIKESKNSFKPDGVNFVEKEIIQWSKEQNSLHIIQTKGERLNVKVVREPKGKIEYYELNKGIERLILSKATTDENQIKIFTTDNEAVTIIPVLDRAHYPVLNASKNSEKYIN